MRNKGSATLTILLTICFLLSISVPAFADADSLYLTYTSSNDGTYYGSDYLAPYDTDFYIEFVDCNLDQYDSNTNYVRFDNESSVKNYYYQYRTAVDEDFMLKDVWGDSYNSDVDMIQVYENDDNDNDKEFVFQWGSGTDFVQPGETAAGYIDFEYRRGDGAEYDWRDLDWTGTDSHLFLAAIAVSDATVVDPSVLSKSIVTINPSRSSSLKQSSKTLTSNNKKKETLLDKASKKELIKQGKIHKVNCPVEIINAQKEKVLETDLQNYTGKQKEIWSQLKKEGKVKNNPFDNNK